MDPTPSHREAEARFRQLVDDAGVDPPDGVEYETDAIVFVWHERQVAVVVELGPAACRAGDAGGGLDVRPAT